MKAIFSKFLSLEFKTIFSNNQICNKNSKNLKKIKLNFFFNEPQMLIKKTLVIVGLFKTICYGIAGIFCQKASYSYKVEMPGYAEHCGKMIKYNPSEEEIQLVETIKQIVYEDDLLYN